MTDSQGSTTPASRSNAAATPWAPPAIPDLGRLHAFLVLADELHYARAAGRLEMSQSPLSRLIKNLEDDLGFQLFVRNRRNVCLTEAGSAFLIVVRDLLATAEYAIARERQNGTL